MKVVLHEGKYKVIDSGKQMVTLSKELNTLDDIFSSHWIKNHKGKCLTNYIDVTPSTSSFKALKHEVAGYLLINNIESDIPTRYINSYLRNIHLYTKIETKQEEKK